MLDKDTLNGYLAEAQELNHRMVVHYERTGKKTVRLDPLYDDDDDRLEGEPIPWIDSTVTDEMEAKLFEIAELEAFENKEVLVEIDPVAGLMFAYRYEDDGFREFSFSFGDFVDTCLFKAEEYEIYGDDD
jgi:hypothetical protein